MKYCKNCGFSVSDEAEYCTNCGQRVEVASEVVNNEVVPVVVDHSIKERNIVVAIILSIITCGIYNIYWLVKLNNESLILANEKGPSGGVVILLNLITCGIYGFFWWYKMGVCSDKINGNDKGNSPVLYIILSILGLGFVNYILAQNVINDKVGNK